MNNTPIQDSFILTRAFVARNLAVLLFFVSLISLNAQALQTAPHWEEIDGNKRYGYWEEYVAAHEEDQGYWDDSIYTGQGRYEYHLQPIYDEEGNFIGEGASEEVWVNDPVWVPVLVWVDAIMQWIDMPVEQDGPEGNPAYEVDFVIEIRQDNILDFNLWRNFICGKKVQAYIRWEVDKNTGDVNIVDMKKVIFHTNDDPSIQVGGYVNIEPSLSATQSSIGLNGTAWSAIDLMQVNNVWLPDWLSNLNPFNINWNLNVNVDSSNHGNVSGTHDRFPSYQISVSSIPVYDYVQDFGSFNGMWLGLIWTIPAGASF
jgi:hypothetical protein